MVDKIERTYPGDIIRLEKPNFASRRAVTVASGTGILKAGTLLAVALMVGVATSAAKSGGNTGNGVMTVDATTPVLPGAKPGVYTVRCIAAATNSGTFRVEDPDGFVLGDVAVGATFADDIKFSIADGATDFIVGDGFDITVTVSASKYKKAVYGATDGTQKSAGILLKDIDATSTDVTNVPVLTHDAQVALDAIIYDASASDDTKKNALRAGLESARVQFLASA